MTTKSNFFHVSSKIPTLIAHVFLRSDGYTVLYMLLFVPKYTICNKSLYFKLIVYIDEMKVKSNIRLYNNCGIKNIFHFELLVKDNCYNVLLRWSECSNHLYCFLSTDKNVCIHNIVCNVWDNYTKYLSTASNILPIV